MLLRAVGAALAVVGAAAHAANCTETPLPYRIDVCDLFHPPKNGTAVRPGVVAAPPGLHGDLSSLGRLGGVLDARLKAAGAAVVIEPGLSFGVELDAAAAAARASVRDATRADRAVAASLADALEALGDAPSLEEIATAARKAFSNKPLECVGCIVAGAFLDLFVVNFGLADAACEVCSCASLTEAACTQAIQVALYAGIALMPVIAVSIFEECEGLCESDTSEVDPPSLAIPR